MILRRLSLLLLVPVVPLLAACAPGVTSVVSPPTFRVVDSETALLRLEPAGIGSGVALVHLELEARNPNPFALNLAGLDGDLYLGGRPVAGSRFTDSIALPAGGTARLGLDVEVPVEGAPELLASLARLVTGGDVEYRMDATVTVDLLGTRQRFPGVTVAQGRLRSPGALRPPAIRLDPAGTQVRLRGLGVEVDVGFEVENPLPFGYYVRAPQAALQIDGRSVGSSSVPRTPVPAHGSTRPVLRFELGLADVGAAMLARLQGGGSGLSVALSGDLAVEIPGIASTSAPLSNVHGLLR